MYKLTKLLMVMAMVALLAGCGGGGGGGGEESSADGIPAAYTGSRSMAAVTTSNARTIATSAYTGVMMAGSLDVLGKAAGDDGIVGSPLLEVVEILEDSAASATVGPKTSAKSAEATVSESRSIYGYSGYYSYDVSVDTVSGETAGSINFVNYRQNAYAVTISGSITFSGVFNSYSSRFTSFKMSFPNLAVTSGSTRVSLSGSVEASNSGSTRTMKMTLALTDNATNRTAALKDYTLTLYNNSLTCTGTFYDSSHGYVTVSTVYPLSVSSVSAQPTSGRLLVTGSNGTKARLTFYSGYYTVEVDATGNGTFVNAP